MRPSAENLHRAAPCGLMPRQGPIFVSGQRQSAYHPGQKARARAHARARVRARRWLGHGRGRGCGRGRGRGHGRERGRG
eukprot:2731126-Alexandrium_andersonii.AAC.1